eukprot:31476-Pelagococcus_subviridis.AAC.15
MNPRLSSLYSLIPSTCASSLPDDAPSDLDRPRPGRPQRAPDPLHLHLAVREQNRRRGSQPLLAPLVLFDPARDDVAGVSPERLRLVDQPDVLSVYSPRQALLEQLRVVLAQRSNRLPRLRVKLVVFRTRRVVAAAVTGRKRPVALAVRAAVSRRLRDRAERQRVELRPQQTRQVVALELPVVVDAAPDPPLRGVALVPDRSPRDRGRGERERRDLRARRRARQFELLEPGAVVAHSPRLRVGLDGNLERDAHRSSAAAARGAHADAGVAAAAATLAVVAPARARALRPPGALAHRARLVRILEIFVPVVASSPGRDAEILEAAGDDEAAEDDRRGASLLRDPVRVADVRVARVRRKSRGAAVRERGMMMMMMRRRGVR